MNAVFRYEQGENLHKPGLGHRERFRITLKGSGDQNVVIYLKRFGYPGIKELVKRWIIRRSRYGAGSYDFLGAQRLAEKGVAVPRPIAYGQISNWLGEKRSFAIIEELPGSDSLERLLPNWNQKKKEYALLRDKKELIRQTAHLVRQLHQSGYNHRDLYLSHIFLSRDGKGCERLNLIDLQRVFQPLILKRRWQVKDLAQLYYSSRDYFSYKDMMQFMHEYFDNHRLTNYQKRLIRSACRKARRIERHVRHRMKRLQKVMD
ncbi:MAG: phosphotransferase [Deltaproteobacteria bacterium]|nr:phosphotransferase [Deltaproteobacteria bacterium]